ncbi:MAG: hypothetical protein ACE5IR_13455 [bacterium]
MKKIMGLVLFVLGVQVFTPLSGYACPGCGAALDATAGRGFNMSTLFLMAMPFVVFGSAAVGIIFVQRSKKQKTNSENHPDHLTRRSSNQN